MLTNALKSLCKYNLKKYIYIINEFQKVKKWGTLGRTLNLCNNEWHIWWCNFLFQGFGWSMHRRVQTEGRYDIIYQWPIPCSKLITVCSSGVQLIGRAINTAFLFFIFLFLRERESEANQFINIISFVDLHYVHFWPELIN